jgi:hypothetical protein
MNKKVLQIIKEEVTRKAMLEAQDEAGLSIDPDQLVDVVTSSQKFLKALEEFTAKATSQQLSALKNIDSYKTSLQNMLQNPKSYVNVVKPKAVRKIVLKPSTDKTQDQSTNKTPIMSS